jgi:hypothetical protein
MTSTICRDARFKQGQDLPAQARAYSSRLEDATGYTVASQYDRREDAFLWYLVDGCGDIEGDGWGTFADLMADTEEQVFDYEHELDLCEGKLWNHPGNWPDGPWLAACTEFVGSDAGMGL